MWNLPGVEVWWAAARIGDGNLPVIGHRATEPVTPASVMKVQVALATASAIARGELDGAARVALDSTRRTPGPVGMSLMVDPIEMSLRDLLVPMMTISDNVATDALIHAVGLEAINATTRDLGLPTTLVVSDLQSMLDDMASEAGFHRYADLAAHDPRNDGPPDQAQVTELLARSSALDPRRGSRTTAEEMVRLLSLIWSDAAGPSSACARIRLLMGQQLTRTRIASGFDGVTTVAAKSGGLMGVVRNEVGVVTTAQRESFAIAIFTRRNDTRVAPSSIDTAIGRLARRLVARLEAEPVQAPRSADPDVDRGI